MSANCLRRFMAILAASSGLLAALPSARAVVHYAAGPIEAISFPNLTMGGTISTAGTDLNFDGIADLILSTRTLYSQITIPEFPNHVEATVAVLPGIENPTAISFMTLANSPEPGAAAALSLGASIGASGAFADSPPSLLFYGVLQFSSSAIGSPPGNYPGQSQSRYLGVRFEVDGAAKYGWVRFSFSGPSVQSLINANGTPFGVGNATIHSYAFEDSGNPIIAGQIADVSADFNLNGVIDGGDIAAWQAAAGISSAGDVDGDGETDGADLLIIQRQLGRSVMLPAIAANSAAAPEPATEVLAVLALAGLRRSHHRAFLRTPN